MRPERAYLPTTRRRGYQFIVSVGRDQHLAAVRGRHQGRSAGNYRTPELSVRLRLGVTDIDGGPGKLVGTAECSMRRFCGLDCGRDVLKRHILGRPAHGKDRSAGGCNRRRKDGIERNQDLRTSVGVEPGQGFCIADIGHQQGYVADRPRHFEIERGILLEDLLLESPQLLRRLYAQFLSEVATRSVIDAKCLCLPPRPVQSKHVPGAETFLEGMLAAE